MYMRNILLVIILSLIGYSASAQQYHYMYLESEKKQPFYVIMDGKVYSSSLAGYLILSKLLNTNYKLTVGFPKNAGPKLTFNYLVKNKDAGFEIKDYGDRGWALMNLQTTDLILAGDVTVFTPPPPRETSADPFSNMLANVVHDSAINQKEVVIEQKEVVKEEPKIEAKNTPTDIKEVIQMKADSIVTAKSDVKVISDIKNDTSQNIKPETSGALADKIDAKTPEHVEEKVKKPDDVQNTALSAVVRKSKKKNKEGLLLVYIDKTNDQSDTISIVVPSEKVQKKKAPADSIASGLNVEKQEMTDVAKHLEKENNTGATDTTLVNPYISVNTEKPLQDTVVVAQVITKESKSDTVAVITINTPSTSVAVKQDTIVKKDTTISNSPIVVEEPHKEPKFIDLKDPSHTTMVNSDCKAFASDDDFMKLRKKMVGEPGDDEMIRVAKKSFKGKCYSTEQVKNLGVLFLKDDGKYAFFETAYPYVSDTELFPSLEKQFTDTYYINRFKAMIHH